MKTKYLLLSFAFAAFLSSYMPMGSHSLETGKAAPALTLSPDSRIDNLSMLEGKYVVINFWSPDDPTSRLNNRHLANVVSSYSSSKIQFVSVCMNDNDILRDEILKADNVYNAIVSLSAKDFTQETAKDFQINSGYRSFMIDPFGNLTAISPTDELIDSILSSILRLFFESLLTAPRSQSI